MPIKPLTPTDLPRGLDVPADELPLVAQCVERALLAYKRLTSRGRGLTGYEMLRVPYLLGRAAVEVVRELALSAETRRRFAAYTLGRARPLEADGIPHGLLALASFLATQGALDLDTLTGLVKMAALDRALSDDLRAAEAIVLGDWLIAQPGLDERQRLWWLWFLPAHCRDHRTGGPWLDHLLAHSVLTQPFRHRLCQAWLSPRPPAPPPPGWRALGDALANELRGESAAGDLDAPLLDLLDEAGEDEDDLAASFSVLGYLMREELGGYVPLPLYLQRRAVLGLVETGADPAAVCAEFAETPPGLADEPIQQGVADVLRAFHARMPPDVIQARLEQGLAHGDFNVRKAFYEAAVAIHGPSAWERAQQDRSAAVRAWAAKQAARKPRKGDK